MWAWLKRTFGSARGLCVPDETQNITLTPPAARATVQEVGSFSGAQQLHDECTDHTPLPLALNTSSRAGGLIDSQHGAAPAQHGAAADTQAEEDQTPPLQVVSGDRYIVSGGMVSTLACTDL